MADATLRDAMAYLSPVARLRDDHREHFLRMCRILEVMQLHVAGLPATPEVAEGLCHLMEAKRCFLLARVILGESYG